MNTIFGIIFSNASGESAELGIESGTNHLYARTTTDGNWSAWVRVDARRKASGALDESVWETEEAKRAQTAMRLSHPMTMRFEGDVLGSVSFDGSGDVTCSLKSAGLNSAQSLLDDYGKRIAKLEARVKRLEDHPYDNDSPAAG